MSSYRHDGERETAGDIGLRVTSKSVENGYVVVKMSRLSSTMAPTLTNEIERIAHTLRATSYTQPTTGSTGFPYTLPAKLG